MNTSSDPMRSTRGARRRDPGIAAVLSFFVPGIGQFYAGHYVWGIVWLIVTPGFWIGSGGLLGWVCHILAAIQAARQVERDARG